MPVKNELVLTADLSTEGNGDVIGGRPLGQHLLARDSFSSLKWRCRKVDDQAGAGGRLIALR